MSNIKAVEAVTEHFLTKAKAYVAMVGTLASLILNSQLHLSSTLHLVVAIASIIGVGLGTFIVPNKQTGITLGQAVATDGELFQQAAEALKHLPLPGPAAQAVDKAETVTAKAVAAEPVVEQVVEQAAPVIEATVPQAAPVVDAALQNLTTPAITDAQAQATLDSMPPVAQ